MRKKLTILHTTLATTTTIPAMIRELYPDEFDIVNVLDDSLLNDIKCSGRMSASVIERFIQYACIAKNNGSDALLLACSSLGKAADIARELLDIPLYKIDEPMADQAVASGNNILGLGTGKSTLEPTSDLIRSKRKSQEQSVTCILIPDVFELYEIDRERHDQKIAEVIQEHWNTYDVIVLAQASMANAIQYITQGREKIVTSLPLGLKQLQEI